MKFLKMGGKGKNDPWRYLLTVTVTNPFLSMGHIIGFIVILTLSYFLGFNMLQGPPFFVGMLDLLSTNIICAFLIILLYLCMVFIHKRDFKTVLTAHETLQWGGFFRGFGAWTLILSLLLLCLFLTDSLSSLKVTFNGTAYPFLLVVSSTIFFQAAFEELFFRGYLLQGVNLATGRPLIAVIITSILFAVGHWGNETTFLGNLDVIIDTFIFGIVTSIITLTEGGIETAIGVHTANNIFATLIVNSGTSSFYEPLPSIFTDFSNPLDPMWQIFYSLTLAASLMILIFAHKRPELIHTLKSL